MPYRSRPVASAVLVGEAGSMTMASVCGKHVETR